MEVFIYLILCHLLGDFVFQTDSIALGKHQYYKEEGKFWSKHNPLLWHGMIIWGLMQILHFFFSPGLEIIVMSIIITILHVATDHMKLVLQKKIKEDRLIYFLLDQFIHLCILYFVGAWFNIYGESQYLPSFGFYKSDFPAGRILLPWINTKYIMALIILILFSYMAGFILSYFLKSLNIVKSEVDLKKEETIIGLGTSLRSRHLSDQEKKIGIKIGILERILVIIFVAAGQFGAMGLILAGKSLARYEELKDRAFAEYYLYGTLLSFLFGITGGLILGKIIN